MGSVETGIVSIWAAASGVVSPSRPSLRRRRLGLSRRRVSRRRALYLALLHAEIEAAQDGLEFLTGTADERHHVGDDGKAAAFDRALRARLLGKARAPENPVADQVGEPLQHVDTHHAGSANAIAAYAIEAARRRTVERSRGQALARRLGKGLDR